ncbi:Integration host factor [Balamuthia mandrillaris]
MGKKELVEALYQHAATSAKGVPLSKTFCASLADTAFLHLRDTLKAEGRFAYPGFGSLVVRRRPEREIRVLKGIPKKGEKLDPSAVTKEKRPAYNYVAFRPSTQLKKEAKGFKEFARE